ncbi:MAG: 2-oxoacid:acceptor oxidoreductase family protein, partial [Eubacteriales bacterium]|nr:2-oxoacid:acceptor oxidoreductase family protein [Eubacteriales bacterium]
AEAAGSAKTVNIVMLGAVSREMDLDESVWEQAIAQCVPAKTIEVNKKAFAAGRAFEKNSGAHL